MTEQSAFRYVSRDRRTKEDRRFVAGKATFVSLLGVDRARNQARMLADQAIQHLETFSESANPLRELARYVVERKT